MTETSLLPKIAAAAGYDFGHLCEAILATARLIRHPPVVRGSLGDRASHARRTRAAPRGRLAAFAVVHRS